MTFVWLGGAVVLLMVAVVGIAMCLDDGYDDRTEAEHDAAHEEWRRRAHSLDRKW
jgi:hypothetical protein